MIYSVGRFDNIDTFEAWLTQMASDDWRLVGLTTITTADKFSTSSQLVAVLERRRS